MAMELNSFLSVEVGAPSTSKSPETSVIAMIEDALEPSNIGWTSQLES